MQLVSQGPVSSEACLESELHTSQKLTFAAVRKEPEQL